MSVTTNQLGQHWDGRAWIADTTRPATKATAATVVSDEATKAAAATVASDEVFRMRLAIGNSNYVKYYYRTL